MRKWNAKELAFAAILAAPLAAVLVVAATSTETGGRVKERFDGAVAAASERWREYFGAESEAQAVEPKKEALPILAPVAPKLASAAIGEASESRPLTQPAQASESRPSRGETSNAETPEPDWTIAPDGALERREARSAVDPDGERFRRRRTERAAAPLRLRPNERRTDWRPRRRRSIGRGERRLSRERTTNGRAASTTVGSPSRKSGGRSSLSPTIPAFTRSTRSVPGIRTGTIRRKKPRFGPPKRNASSSKAR